MLIDLEYWFSTPIWCTKLDVNNKKIEKICKQLKKKNKGRILSNRGGWQSNDIYIKDCDDFNLTNLFEQMFDVVIGITDKFGIHDDLFVNKNTMQFWININNKGDYNLQHNHPRSFLSGVYYVKTPKNCGLIEFHHPNTMQKFWYQLYTKGDNPATFPTVTFQPEEGKLIIFPPWLEHTVAPNQNESDRISIAFNINVNNK